MAKTDGTIDMDVWEPVVVILVANVLLVVMARVLIRIGNKLRK